MQPEEPHHSATAEPDFVPVPIRSGEAAEALRNGPVGAMVVSTIAVAILFIGWMVFYFLLFLPRGPIG
jgi:hypothetical protein